MIILTEYQKRYITWQLRDNYLR